jgi:hypothetical protein
VAVLVVGSVLAVVDRDPVEVEASGSSNQLQLRLRRR